MTSFKDIYELAMITISDYRLDKLASNDYEAFKLHMQGILVRSIYLFNNCQTSLDYSLTNDGEFVELLDDNEKNILADTMVITWFSRNVSDIVEINLHLQGRAVKTHSEQANLKQKKAYLTELEERLIVRKNNYENLHIDPEESW